MFYKVQEIVPYVSKRCFEDCLVIYFSVLQPIHYDVLHQYLADSIFGG